MTGIRVAFSNHFNVPLFNLLSNPQAYTMPSLPSKRGALPGISREDSDDELGIDDHPWEWIYADKQEASQDGTGRKRKRVTEDVPEIIGARMGSFECALGDIVFLKAEGSGEAWIAIICEFFQDEEGEKAAHFMWFSSEKEIRNKQKKRTDHLWVCF